MPRSVVLSVKDINMARAKNWEFHYQSRSMAKTFAVEDRERIEYNIRKRCPAPVLRVDAALLDGIENLRAMAYTLAYLSLRLDRSMMCVWYWSETSWMDFVREFQSLPEVLEPHYLFYDEVLDAVQIKPLSTMGSNRPRKYKIQGEVRGKSGGSGRLVPEKSVRFGGAG